MFQGRYKDQIVQRDGYLRNLLRYIALNPVRAGLVHSPELWPWSAYRCLAGLAANPGFVSIYGALAEFGDGAVGIRRVRYVEHVLAGMADDEEAYKRFRSRQRVLGDRQFKKELREPPLLSDGTTVRGSNAPGAP